MHLSNIIKFTGCDQRVLRIFLENLPEHPSDTKVFTMKMEILLEPTSNKLLVGTLPMLHPRSSEVKVILSSFQCQITVWGDWSGTLPGNTVTNPKEDLKGITNRSGVAYKGPTIATPSKVVKQADLGASINLMLLSMWKELSLPELTLSCMTLELADRSVSKPLGIAKDVKVKVGMFHFPADFVVVDFEPDPRVPLILGRCFLKTGRALIDVHKGELTLRIGNEAITYNLDQTSRYTANYDQMTASKIDVTDKACEEYFQEVLDFSNVTASGSPTPSDDPIVSTTSPMLTPFGDSDFLLFEEANAFLGLEDDPDSPELDPSYYDPEGDIQMLEAILNSDRVPSLPNHEQYVPSFTNELKACEAKTIKSSVDEPPEVELKDLPPHLEYAFLEGDNKLPILMEEDYKPTIQHQRHVNPKIYDVIKKEVEKLLDAGLIYPISDSPWASPVHYVPKKGGFTVVKNEENELIPTRLVTGWQVCIDYRKLNEATRKDHFPLSFTDQMLERLAGNEYYCFLDGFSGYFQIPIDPRDQEKTTFTSPYGTFAYRRMPFGLCNAPETFQRCMLAIFHDMVEKTMEVFMDDFSVFGNSFKTCLSRLDKILQRYEDTKLCLNWEKSHFMVKEGIVLGHKISRNGIEVDKAKVDVITKLPHPTTVKGYHYPIATPSKVLKQGTGATKDPVQTPNPQSTTHVQPPVTQSETLVSEPIAAPVNAPMPNLKPSIPYPSRRENKRRREQANEEIEKFYEIFKDMSFEISFTDALILMPKFASTLKALIGNKEKLGEIDRTPCLALADLGASINLMPLSMWKELSLPELTLTCMTLELADRSVSKPLGIAKDVKVKVGMFHFPADFVVVDFEPDPRVPLILGRCFLKTGRALIHVHKGELTLRIRNEAITYNLDQTSRYSANYNQMTASKFDVTDKACEEYFQEVLDFSNVTTSCSPTPSDDPIVSTTSPMLTPFGDSDFLLFEEANAFPGIEDDPDSPELDPSYYDPEGDIQMLEAILNSDPVPSLLNHEQSVPSFTNELKACEAKTIKSFVDEPPEVELKDLPPHLEYEFLEGDNKFPVIISKELGEKEK
nr:reverse transcriptase domain-containing protein [Tanacetum cinerariifolium]